MLQGRSVTGRLALGITFILLAPSALATQANGVFTLANPMRFPSGTEATLEPLAILHNDTARLDGFSLEAPFLRVRWFEWRTAGLPGGAVVQIDFEERQWTVPAANVSLLLDGDSEGFLGVYPRPGGSVSWEAPEGQEMETRPFSTMGSTVQSTPDSPDVYYYFQRIAGSHLYSSAPGILTHTGAANLKVNGPDVRIRGAHNVSDLETGRSQVSAAEVVYRWLYLTVEEGTFRLESPSFPVEIAASNPQVAWNGKAVLRPLEGSLRAEEGVYSPTGKAAEITGAFTASLTPLPDGRSARMELGGDLESATALRLAPAPAPFRDASGAAWLPWFIGAAVVVVGGAAAAFLLEHRKRPRPPPAEAPPAPAAVIPPLAPPVDDLERVMDSRLVGVLC